MSKMVNWFSRFQPDETKANEKEDKKSEAESKDDKKENSGSTEGGDKQVQNFNMYRKI